MRKEGPGLTKVISAFNSIEPGFWSRTSFIQLGYGIWMIQVSVGIGMTFGLSAVMIPQLKRHSDATFRLSLNQEAWIASVLTLFSPIGCIFSGFAMDKYGRKPLFIACYVPMGCGWLCTGFANKAEIIILGRMLSGIGIGIALSTARTYGTEITLPNMRGVLGAFPNLALALGLTIMAYLGSILHWRTLCYIAAGHSFFFMIVNLLLPETPYFVLKTGTVEQATKNLKKFRSKKHPVETEINLLLEFKNRADIRRLTPKEQIIFMMKPGSCRPFLIIMVYLLLGQMAGVTVITFWTVEILDDSNITIDSGLGNALLGMSRLFSGFVMAILLFKVGRRPLALISAAGCGFAALLIGLFVMSTTEKSIFPLIGYMIFVASATCGHYTLPLLMLYEMIPLQVRGVLGGLSVSCMDVTIFIANILYPYARNALGYGVTVVGFSVFSFMSFFFLYFYLPETKGMSLSELEKTEVQEIRRVSTSRSRSIVNMEIPMSVPTK